MNSIPVTYYGKSQTVIYDPPAPSTQSLLCWLDAGLTASYTSGSSTWNDLSGNGFNATLTGSASMSYQIVTNEGNFYNYCPAFRFENSGQADPKLWVVSSSLCDALNPSNTSFPFSICQTPPTYEPTGDWSVILIGRNGYDIFTSYPGIALRIGDSSTAKFIWRVTSGDPSMVINARYVSGTRVLAIGGSARGFATNYASKTCWANSKATYGGYYNTPYVTSYSNIDNINTYSIASQLLTGSGVTTIGTDWNGYIQAVLIYNRILSPTEFKDINNYYFYRKLN